MSKTEIAHLLESIISPKLNGVWFQNQNILPKSLVFKVVTNIFCNKVIFTWLNLTITWKSRRLHYICKLFNLQSRFPWLVKRKSNEWKLFKIETAKIHYLWLLQQLGFLTSEFLSYLLICFQNVGSSVWVLSFLLNILRGEFSLLFPREKAPWPRYVHKLVVFYNAWDWF